MKYELFKDRQIVIARQNIKEKTYWSEKFSGDLVKSIFPYDNNYRKTSRNGTDLSVAAFEWTGNLFADFMAQSQGSYYKIHLIGMSGLILLLSKYTGNKDIIISTPIYKPDIEGKYINTVLPIRIQVETSITFRDMLNQVGKTLLEASENQNYPIRILLDLVGIPLCEGEPSLLDTAILVKNIHNPHHIRHINPGVTFSFLVEKDSIKGEVEYRSDFYKGNTIDRIVTHFNLLVGKAVSNLNWPVSDLDLLSDEERKRILMGFNCYSLENSDWSGIWRAKTIHGLFETQVEKAPEQLAIGGEGNLSYDELNKKSNRLAAQLRRRGVIPGIIVGIEVESSVEMIVGIMAILKTGGVCLPISPHHNKKIKYAILEENRPALLLTKKDLLVDEGDSSNFPCTGNSEDLAYILCTPGIPGKSRGVEVIHRDIIALVNEFDTAIFHRCNRGLNFCLISSFASVGSFTQIFGALLLGHCLYIVPENVRMGGLDLCRFYKSYNIEISDGTPSHIALISACQTGPLEINVKRFIIGGSILHEKTVERFFNRFDGNAPEITYVYWPTRNWGMYALQDISRESTNWFNSMPFVKPLPGRRIYILDPQDLLLPERLEGELSIDKETVGKESLEGMYRTGDTGRWLPDGSIELLGRSDRRVTIKGNRIDLEKIERLVLKYKPLSEAAVIVRNDEGSGNHLCVYFVSDRNISESELREYLSGELLPYLIPLSYTQLEKMPLGFDCNPDMNALCRGEGQVRDRCALPMDSVEEKLLHIWSDVLEIEEDRIRIDTDFFRLNGQSLQAIMLSTMIHKEFNISIPLPVIFELSTIVRMAEYIKEGTILKFSLIEPTEEKEYYSVTSAQNRFYLLQQMEKSITYNVPQIVYLEENLDVEKLNEVFKRLIERHETLRTSFEIINDIPVQRIHQQVEFTLEYWDLEGMEPKNDEKKIVYDFVRPFALSQAPLLRVGIIKLDNFCYILMIDRHHIISDATSRGISLNEFIDLYGGRELTPLRLQYKDYSEWLNTDEQKEALKKQKDFWLKQFEDEIPILELPLDYSRLQIQSFEGATADLRISREEMQKLRKIAEQEGVTLFMVLFGVYNIFLSKISNQEDIIVGTPVVGRRHADLEYIMGAFVNTLALRNFPSGAKRFSDFLSEIKERTLNAFENQDYPFEDIVENVLPTRNINRNPLFDVMFSFQDIFKANNETREQAIAGLKVKPYSLEHRISKFDLTLSAIETGKTLFFRFEYCTKLFREETILRFIRYFKKIISLIIENSKKKISEIEIITGEEKRQLLYDFNDTAAEYPRDKTILQLFEEQVEKTPGRVALVGSKERKGQTALTYGELNKKSDQLARLLREKGVEAGSIVGLMVGRSPEIIIGIMSILITGGAYLPLDPEYPKERIDFMLSDSGARILLTALEGQVKINAEVKEQSVETIDIDNLLFSSTLTSTFLNLTQLPQPHRPAYIIYTSGTTGRPKGVIIEHTNVVRLFFNDRCLYDFNKSDVWTMFHSYCFDFSVWEMYGALLFGGKLVIIPKIVSQDPQAFLTALQENSVTILNQTPSAFYNLIYEELKHERRALNLRYVIFGGEALSPVKLKEWRQRYPGTKLINMFGITETTVHVTYKEITDKEIDANISCIGTPIPTLSAYLLDSGLKLSPIGVPGELCVGGSGVGRGYLNRPELTHEKFIENPFKKSERLYKSGDQAKLASNGEIEYLGRIDQQVQVRGFRVEAGEIENQLLKHEDIKDVIVIAREDKENNKFLTAYIVSDSELSVSQLIGFLSNRLPDYIIPAYFVQITRIPLTSNGKIDKSKLPEPNVTSGEEYAAPGDKIEEELVEAWKEVLELEKIGVTDNFFNIGGDSIKAIRLVNSINNRFHTNIKLLDLFTNNTIRELAQVVKKGTAVTCDKEVEEAEKELEEFKTRIMQTGKIPEDVEDVFLMSDIEKGMIFYLYKNPDQAIYHDQFVYNQKYSMFNPDIFRRALELMVEKHPNLRTSYNVDDFDEFVHIIHKPFPAAYKHFDIQGLDSPAQRQYIIKYMEDDRKDRWDITSPPLWRMTTFNLGSVNICAVWTFHHSILDGWSNASLMTELNNTYLELKADKNYTPGKLKISYKEFIIQEMAEKKKVSNIDFWKKELEDYKRISFPEVGKNEPGEIHDFVPPPSMFLNEKLIDASKRYNTSLKHMCFAAYVYTLSMLTYENDVVVGLVSNNRPGAEDGDKLIGCFLNTLPFRINIPAEITWSEYIPMVDRKLIQLKPYEKITFFEIVKAIGERNRAENPIFDTIFNYIDFHIYKKAAAENNQSDDDRRALITGYEKTNTLFDFTVKPSLQGISVVLRYSTSFISDQMAAKLYGYFERILKLMISRPEDVIKKDEIISYQEKQRLLYEFNDTDTGYPKDKTIQQLFEEQVGHTPDHIAVVGSSAQITYRELNEKSNWLAHVLKEKGIQPDTIVGIKVERSIEMIIGILGILKSGGAYLPIDPDYPKDRIDYMLKDSGAKVLVTTNTLFAEVEILRSGEGKKNFGILFLDTHSSPSLMTSNLLNFLTSYPFNLAYIIYTSGSTGKPKGVMVEHGPVVNLLSALHHRYPLREEDTYLLKTSYLFDVSVTELFGWFLEGGRQAILEPGGEKDPEAILDMISREGVTHINFVPSMFHKFVEILDTREIAQLPGLKYIFLAGEALLPTAVNRFRCIHKSIAIENIYGPTEATVYASWYSLADWGGDASIPIGKPLPNVTFYILDKWNNFQPIRVVGELCISGVGLARGYLNKPASTFEKFCPRQPGTFLKKGSRTSKNFLLNQSPFTTHHSPIYKTGDLACWLPDGNIEFMGRIDNQVKIRGYRIELGEIENQLLKIGGIKEAVVLAREEVRDDKYICAYFVSDREYGISELREYLSNELPDYMIPSHFSRLEKIPLTVNGKIDRKTLDAVKTGMQTGVEYAAPTNEIEEKITDIWKETLRLDEVGIHHNFFDLGGNSLQIITINNKIKRVLEKNIPVTKMFAYPTIHSLANYLSHKETNDTYSDKKIKESVSIWEESMQMLIGDVNDDE